MSYIKVGDKTKCCGCSACVDACPMHCISMETDEESFYYPMIDKNKCIKCGKCIKVCSMQQSGTVKNKNMYDIAYAYVSEDLNGIKASSSGGAFSSIMDAFVQEYKENYIICGAAYDGVKVVHTYVENRAASDIFRKSKYVQSDARGIYTLVKKSLEDGKAVLFSGTPCIVAALKTYLGREYERLVTVDIICHGVPSRDIFEKYLKEFEEKCGCKVKSIEFRVKKGFDSDNPNPRTMNIFTEDGRVINLEIAQCEYLYGFHTGLYFRPSCYKCKYACEERTGDITLGDYWGIEKIHPELQSKRGVSLVKFNTAVGEKYEEFIENTGTFIPTKYSFACTENEQLRVASKKHRNRSKFFRLQKKGRTLIESVNICKQPDNLIQKIIHKIDDIMER